jgi:hypothetical protein
MAMFSPTSLYRALALNLPLFSRPASLLWAFGILAFLVSVASPDDDSFQQEVFHPKSSNVLVKHSLRQAPGDRRPSNATQRWILTLPNPLTRLLCRVIPENETPASERLRPLPMLRSPPGAP